MNDRPELTLVIAKTFAINEGLLPSDQRFEKFFQMLYLERGLLPGVAAFLAGVGLLCAAIWQWRSVGFGRLDYAHTMRRVTPGVTLTVLGFQTILSSFL